MTIYLTVLTQITDSKNFSASLILNKINNNVISFYRYRNLINRKVQTIMPWRTVTTLGQDVEMLIINGLL